MEESYSVNDINIDGYYYLLSDLNSVFGFYVKAGGSLKIGNSEIKVKEFMGEDEQSFDASDYEEDERIGGLHVNLGLGLSSTMDFGTVFTDFQIGLVSAEERNSRQGTTSEGLSDFPTTGNFVLGAMIDL